MRFAKDPKVTLMGVWRKEETIFAVSPDLSVRAIDYCSPLDTYAFLDAALWWARMAAVTKEPNASLTELDGAVFCHYVEVYTG